MAVKLRRPILVGGLGLTVALWLLDSLQHSAVELGTVATVGAMATGAGFWCFRQWGAKPLSLQAMAAPVERATVEKAIADVESVITLLETEASTSDTNQPHSALAQVTPLRDRVAQLQTALDRQDLNIAILGGQSVGKSALLQTLNTAWLPQQTQSLTLQELPSLFTGTADSLAADTQTLDTYTADLALFVTAGDLTDSELQTLKQLLSMHQRLLLVFNKQDQYLPAERAVLLKQLQDRLRDTVPNADIVAIAAAPAPVKVRQHQSDGSAQEWMEQPTPDLVGLTDRLSHICTTEVSQLVCASTWRSALQLRTEAQTLLNQVRRDCALPLVEQFQWIAAGTAFANPVPALDLLATTAITAQMIMDLGNIYQQKFSFQQAQTVASTLGSLLLKLGLVELSTQTIGTVLKSNMLTFVAGGCVQGVSAAYLTRVAGLSLIEYFQEQSFLSTPSDSPLKLERLSQIIRTVFQQNQQITVLQSFVKQVASRLSPAMPAPSAVTSAVN